jgi:uridylate kinase
MPLHSYRRILLKLSGEILLEGQPFGIQRQACQRIAQTIKAMRERGLEIGIVMGGGNIFRGINLKLTGMERTPADQMGMLATLINGVALQQSLEDVNCQARLLTALECPRVAETYTWRGALQYLNSGSVVIFVGGTGNPYFTTDTAAALRASEIHADILMKATKVDGIYNKDPLKNSDAIKYTSLSYSQMLAEKLEVMDATAVALCRNNHIPILVFNMKFLTEDNSVNILLQQNYPGTLVSGN